MMGIPLSPEHMPHEGHCRFERSEVPADFARRIRS